MTCMVTSASAKDDMCHVSFYSFSTPLYSNNKVESTSFSFIFYFICLYVQYKYKLKEGLREGLFLDLEFHDIRTYIYIDRYNLD